jgi:hypothetical protein
LPAALAVAVARPSDTTVRPIRAFSVAEAWPGPGTVIVMPTLRPLTLSRLTAPKRRTTTAAQA